MTTQLNKGDVCSLEVVVSHQPTPDEVIVIVPLSAAPAQSMCVPADKLTPLRRAPVDLATCELPVEVQEPKGHGATMIARDQGWAFLRWHEGEHGLYPISKLRPLDAPAPESELERLRDVEQRKFYRSDWTIKQLLEARIGGLLTDDGEAWRYQFSNKDAKGEYDMLYRPVTTPTRPPGHIMIGDRAVPEPVRHAPAVGDVFWLADACNNGPASLRYWADSPAQRLWLQRGLIHSTEANARAHAEAIIALSAGEGV